MELPVLALIARAVRRLASLERLRVDLCQREVLPDNAYLVAVGLHDSFERRIHARAERALVVRILDDRDRRVCRPLDRVGGRDFDIVTRRIEEDANAAPAIGRPAEAIDAGELLGYVQQALIEIIGMACGLAGNFLLIPSFSYWGAAVVRRASERIGRDDLRGIEAQEVINEAIGEYIRSLDRIDAAILARLNDLSVRAGLIPLDEPPPSTGSTVPDLLVGSVGQITSRTNGSSTRRTSPKYRGMSRTV